VNAPVCTLCNPPQIALTFDDGPSDYTEQLLELLRSHHDTKATFFLVGQNVDSRSEIVRKIHAAGHAIGNHSYSHPDLGSLANEAEVKNELVKCEEAIKAALGGTAAPIRIFRAPRGDARGHVLSVADSLGLRTINWSAEAGDWREDPDSPGRPKSARGIVDELSGQIDSRKQGEIILLHDGHPPRETCWGGSRINRSEAIKATDELLKMYLGKRGFVTLSTEVQMT
jgi:peptidoglycan-N-acetylglucosamine deacetylase